VLSESGALLTRATAKKHAASRSNAKLTPFYVKVNHLRDKIIYNNYIVNIA